MDVLRFCIAVVFLQGYASATCRFPGAPAHCSVTFSNESLSEGTYAVYECERGFELLGPSRRLCSDNGLWTPDGIPFCVLNVAAGKAPMQSSTEDAGVPQRALDGSTADAFNADTCTLTKTERVPWWYVNLLEPYMVQLVRLDFGKPCCGTKKPPVIVVRVGNNRPDLGTNPICNRFIGFVEEGQPLFLPCNPPMPGAFVSVHLEASSTSQLSICEAFVYTDQALPIERCPQFRDQPPGSTATYNGKCYIFYDKQPAPFKDALGFCRSRGGTLVDESNPALQGFISWELWRRHRSESSSQYWIGAVRDPAAPNNWKWVNGDDMTVSFWNAPFTNLGCAKFDGSFGWLWADTDCMSRLNYICQHQPKTCGRPEQPPNSTIMITEFGVGSSVEYTCDDGYLLVGSTVRTCLDTGFYDEFPPVCKRIECGYPAAIANGGYRLLNGTVTYLSHVQYMCKQGFEIVGRSHLICDIDERWNGPPPRCEEVTCESPPSIANGRASLIHYNTSVGMAVEYSCAPGYSIQGAKSAKCLPEGLWEHPAPLCLLIETSTTSTSKTTTSTLKSSTPETTTPKPKSADLTTHRLLRRTSTRPSTTPRAEARPPSILLTSRKPRPKLNTTTFNVSTEQPVRLTTRGYVQPDRKTTVQDSQDSPTSHVPHIIVASHPIENQIFGSSSNNNIRAEQTPRVNLPTAVDGERREPTGARLNIGAVVALAAFGALVFVIAIITTVVILVRSKVHKGQTYPKRRHRACTVESIESSSSESRSGLTRYYQQNWEQLQEVAGDLKGQHLRVIRDDIPMKDHLEVVVNNDSAPIHRSMPRFSRRHHHHHHHRREPSHTSQHQVNHSQRY